MKITDEQIRELIAALGVNYADLGARALSPLASKCPTCEVESGTACTDMTRSGYRTIKAPHAKRVSQQTDARARCAEILNARATASDPKRQCPEHACEIWRCWARGQHQSTSKESV